MKRIGRPLYKLTVEQLEEIREKLKKGYGPSMLAREYGVDHTTITHHKRKFKGIKGRAGTKLCEGCGFQRINIHLKSCKGCRDGVKWNDAGTYNAKTRCVAQGCGNMIAERNFLYSGNYCRRKHTKKANIDVVYLLDLLGHLYGKGYL